MSVKRGDAGCFSTYPHRAECEHRSPEGKSGMTSLARAKEWLPRKAEPQASSIPLHFAPTWVPQTPQPADAELSRPSSAPGARSPGPLEEAEGGHVLRSL